MEYILVLENQLFNKFTNLLKYIVGGYTVLQKFEQANKMTNKNMLQYTIN